MRRSIIFIVVVIILAVLVFAVLEWQEKRKIEPQNEVNNLSGETLQSSGEIQKTYKADSVMYLDAIDRLAGTIQNMSGEKKEKQSVSITKEMYGSEIEEFQNTLEVEEVLGEIETYEDKYVAVLPYSDFLDAQKYYYVAGKLVMYSREFMGIGGRVNYYFLDGKLMQVETELEPNFQIEQEDSEEILERAEFNYQTFLNE